MTKSTFYILGFDTSGQPTGPVGKKPWDSQEDAEKHAVEVLKTNHASPRFVIVEERSLVQRAHPPIEVLQLGDAPSAFLKKSA